MEIINFQNKKWLIKFKSTDVSMENDYLNWFKSFHDADQVLKKDNILYFVEEIPELTFNEDFKKIT